MLLPLSIRAGATYRVGQQSMAKFLWSLPALNQIWESILQGTIQTSHRDSRMRNCKVNSWKLNEWLYTIHQMIVSHHPLEFMWFQGTWHDERVLEQLFVSVTSTSNAWMLLGTATGSQGYTVPGRFLNSQLSDSGSQNHRIVWVGKTFKGHLVQPPCNKQ